jgi:hypothetical protein
MKKAGGGLSWCFLPTARARREAMERQAELVDQMGQKLALWDLEVEGGSRVTLVQDAVVDGPLGE